MPRFNFFENMHGDVGLSLGEGHYNFGYDYTCFFPLVNWLYHRQTSQTNLFRDLPFQLQPPIELKFEIEGPLRESASLYARLPLSPQDFNEGLLSAELHGFGSAPNYRIGYNWDLRGDTLHLSMLRPKETKRDILELTPETNRDFAMDYYKFLTEKAQNSGCSGAWVSQIIRALKEV